MIVMTTFSNILEAVFDYIEHQLVLAAVDRTQRGQRRSSRRAEAQMQHRATRDCRS